MTAHEDYKTGVEKAGGLIALVAAATPVTVYQLAPGRTCKLRKLHIFNGNAAASLLEIGRLLAGAFVRILPRIQLVAGMDLILTKEQLAGFEWEDDITAQTSVAGAAPADVQMRATVEEYQGPTG